MILIDVGTPWLKEASVWQKKLDPALPVRSQKQKTTKKGTQSRFHRYNVEEDNLWKRMNV